MPPINRSYLILRQAIGLLGIILPFVLIIGNGWLGKCNEIEPSISHYYYTIMHIVFVGVLSIVGAFLICYRGKYRSENIVSNIAGFLAFCVAIFPTDLGTAFIGDRFISTPHDMASMGILATWVGIVHLSCAAALFVCFAIFCICIFQLPDDEVVGYDAKKRLRNSIYKFCGWGITLSIVTILVIWVIDLVNKTTISDTYKTTLFFETTSLLCFGFSWLLKGSFAWKQSKNPLLRNLVQYFR